jgi:hypothetical protein
MRLLLIYAPGNGPDKIKNLILKNYTLNFLSDYAENFFYLLTSKKI